MSKFISPLNDIVFKTLWLRADDDLKEYLNRLISYSIKRDISDFRIGANATGVVNIDNIANEVDILLENGDEKIDIELNNIRDDKGEATIRRALNKSLIYLTYYITTYYDKDKKNKYKKVIKVEQVNLNAFHCQDNYLIERLDYRLCDTNNQIYEKGIEYHHVYLPRMAELCYTNVDDIYKDFAILMCESYEDMEKLAGSNKGRKALIKMLKSLGRDGEFMSVIDREEYRKIIFESSLEHYKEQGIEQGIEEGIEKGIKQGIQEGLEKGIEQGIEKGIEQGIEQGKNIAYKDVVLSMNDKGYPLEEIAKILDISLDKVQNILDN